MKRTPLKPMSDKKRQALKAAGRRVSSSITGPRKRPKARNEKRRASEFARCFHSAERVAFVQGLPCVVSGESPCENAHIAGDGIGRKAGYDKIIPLAPRLHRLQHDIGAGTFAIRFRLNLKQLAADTEESWQTYLREKER
jgi:hypothetical protein